MRLVIAALAVVLCAGVASAATVRKVPQAYETIQSAVDDADPGDTILVSKRPDGKPWDERVQTTKSLKFIGKKVVWDGLDAGGGAGRCLTFATDGDVNEVLVQGFIFRNGSEHLYIGGNNATVQSCTFRGAYGTALRIIGGRASVLKCAFRGNSTAMTISGQDALVERNTANGQSSGGISVYGSGASILGNRCSRTNGGYGILASGESAEVSGNTVTEGYGGISVSGDEALVEKNRVSRDFGGSSVVAYGRGIRILGNQVSQGLGTGIYLYGDEGGSEAGSLVEGNTVRSVASTGILTSGWTTTVRGNTVSQVRNAGIDSTYYIADGDGRVESNRVSDAGGQGIAVGGGGYEVVGNDVRYTYDDGIYCGAGPAEQGFLVAGNRVQGSASTGIHMNCLNASFEIVDNEISDGFAESYGIWVNDQGATGGTVSGNRVTNMPGRGIWVYAPDNVAAITIQDNTIVDSGTGYDMALEVQGIGSLISGNVVTGAIGAGMGVFGDGNTVDGNTVKDCGRVGIVVAGSGATVIGNTGHAGDGEGFVNFGASTVFTGNAFLGFRLDVANAGTFATPDIDAVNIFETGGAGTAPQIWVP